MEEFTSRAMSEQLEPDGSVSLEWTTDGAPAEADPVLDRHKLRVWFDPDGERVVSVQLTIPRGITPTLLQRGPWRRLFTVADNVRRYEMVRQAEINSVLQLLDGVERPATPLGKLSSGYPEMVDAMGRYQRREPVTSWRDHDDQPRRPGRKGHPADFYATVAKRYLQLRAEGTYNPTATIAKERGYSRNTVAGWVRKARELRYLPKGRPGKAG